MKGYELNHSCREAWAEWLSAEPWDAFVTLTDPGLSHPEHMSKRCRYLETQINEHLYGRNFRRKGKGIETIWGLERQTRGSVHAHGLVRLPDHDITDPNQFSLRYWQDFASKLGYDRRTRKPSGFARIDLPRSTDDVVDYVTKYAVKGGEIIIGPNFRPSNPRTVDQTLLGRTYRETMH